MRAVTATGIVHPDHTLTVPVPQDVPPGKRTVVVVLTHNVADFLRFASHITVLPLVP